MPRGRLRGIRRGSCRRPHLESALGPPDGGEAPGAAGGRAVPPSEAAPWLNFRGNCRLVIVPRRLALPTRLRSAATSPGLPRGGPRHSRAECRGSGPWGMARQRGRGGGPRSAAGSAWRSGNSVPHDSSAGGWPPLPPSCRSCGCTSGALWEEAWARVWRLGSGGQRRQGWAGVDRGLGVR